MGSKLEIPFIGRIAKLHVYASKPVASLLRTSRNVLMCGVHLLARGLPSGERFGNPQCIKHHRLGRVVREPHPPTTCTAEGAKLLIGCNVLQECEHRKWFQGG